MTTQILTLAGIILTFIVGVANLYVAFRNSRKTIFINSITSSRIKYIQDLRNNISEFCGLVYSYNAKNVNLTDKDLFEIHKEADKLKYRLRLYLNPEDIYWDTKIMDLMSEILTLTDKDPTNKIEDLMIITQYLLKLEWEGAKLESQKGIISKEEKRTLYEKYVELHRNHINKP